MEPLHHHQPPSPEEATRATVDREESHDPAERDNLARTSRWAITRSLGGGDGSPAAHEPLAGPRGAAPAGGAADAATAEQRVAAEPTWSPREIGQIQTQLRRLGLYRLTIDRSMGGGTRAALVEAFGGDAWRTLGADQVLERLAAVPTPADTGDRFHYGQMFRDGVLDITLGVGFDEGGNHQAAIAGFQRVLGARGFALDPGRAAALYAQAGRGVQAADFGQFYVRENLLTYTPPVGGEGRPIHGVVRLVHSADGDQGAQAAGAFREGMAQSDIAYYSGHGRYGSGPDFDRNLSFELLDGEGNVEQSVLDYQVLERLLAAEGRSAGRGAWQQFLWRVDQNRIRVLGTNQGNVFLNPENRHAGEFGARLMYWNLQRTGEGAPQVTGREGLLAEGLTSPSARAYRVLVFDGCRTQDYTTSIRRTPGVTAHSADILATRRTLDWGDEVDTLAAFLDGIIAQQNKKELVTHLDAQQSGEGPAYADQ